MSWEYRFNVGALHVKCASYDSFGRYALTFNDGSAVLLTSLDLADLAYELAIMTQKLEVRESNP